MREKTNYFASFYKKKHNFDRHVTLDCPILASLLMENKASYSDDEMQRIIKVASIIKKIALRYLPGKPRSVFYSVWCNSYGDKTKGIIEYSKKINRSIFTNYTTLKIAYKKITYILKVTGYDEILVKYIRGEYEEQKNDKNKKNTKKYTK